jgi:hypothetical protein
MFGQDILAAPASVPDATFATMETTPYSGRPKIAVEAP